MSQTFQKRLAETDESYREGVYSGYWDAYLEHDSIVGRTATWGRYAQGYVDGRMIFAQGAECPVKKA